VYNNSRHGFEFFYTNDCFLKYNTIYGNLGLSGPGCGIYLYNANGTIIESNTIYDNIHDGIYSIYSNNCEILNNIIFGNDRYGINVLWATSWVIQSNEISNQVTAHGIHFYQCDSFAIDDNELYSNPMGGIRIYQSDNCNFTNNIVYENGQIGVHVHYSYNTRVIGNIIYDNYYGISVEGSNATRIFYNDIVLNYHEAIEFLSTGLNYWDDGVSMGNWWWGIPTDLASYIITNGSVDVNADSYPMASMWIDDAAADTYELASTGNLVTWTAYAYHPDFYEVYAGSTLLGSGPWSGSNITFNVDGFSVGVHDLEIVIYHISGHNLTASVELTVEDTTSPVWASTPEDQTINFGEPLSYQLDATDHSALTWSVNNTLFSISGGLLTNADALDVGDYYLRITVEDIYGNELSVVISVHVLATPPGGLPPGTIMLLSIGAGGAIVVVIILVVIKKKGT
jgi:parallel beta-helix repeat protein